MPQRMLLAAALIAGLASLLAVQDVAAQDATQGSAKRIFLPPPLAWDHDMLTSQPALRYTPMHFANLTGGIAFGMTPADVNARLPEPYPGLSWTIMPQATEFRGEVRYFWTRLNAAGPLRVGMGGCAGAGSYLVFLFNAKGLVRLSYRLTPDASCRDVVSAARDIFARYVTLGPELAASQHYRTGTAEVVDITDATAGDLIATRWRQAEE